MDTQVYVESIREMADNLQQESRFQGRKEVLSALIAIRFNVSAAKLFSSWMAHWDNQESAVMRILTARDYFELRDELPGSEPAVVAEID